MTRIGNFLILLLMCSQSHFVMGAPKRSAECQFEFARISSAAEVTGRGNVRYGLFHVSACRDEVTIDGRMAENGRFEVDPLSAVVQKKNQDGVWIDIHGLAGSYLSPPTTLVIRSEVDAWVWVGFFVGEMANDTEYRIRLSLNKGQASLYSRPFTGRQANVS